jgi:ATP-dependent Clp protease protease subunit
MRATPEDFPSQSWPEGPNRDALRTRLLEQRIVMLGGPLDSVEAGVLMSQLLLLTSRDDRSEIRLYVNSPGGEAQEFFGIYDTMQNLAAPVVTICMSQAKGTAALVLAAGRPGKRLAFRHSSILLRLPEPRVEGSVDVETQVQEARRQKGSLIAIVARHTGLSEENVDDLERGLLLDAEEAKAHGVVDAVIDPGHPYFVPFSPPPRPGGNGGSS